MMSRNRKTKALVMSRTKQNKAIVMSSSRITKVTAMLRTRMVVVSILLTSSIFVTACSSSDDDMSEPTSNESDSVPSEFADCTYHDPGDLAPGSGEGVVDRQYWSPDMISPFGNVKAVARSQVYSPGGLGSSSSDQCAAENFEYPHRDTFCERRSADRDSYNCPSRRIHQGIDINAGTRAQCLSLIETARSVRNGAPPETANLIPVLAVVDGQVSYIGSYTVDLRPAEGSISRYRYLHLNMQTLNVEFGSQVSQGDIIGYYSNDFGSSSTTYHLHFEVIAFVDGIAQYVSPFASFILAEERSKGVDCTRYDG